jgi:predicted ester cyclase
MAAAASSEGPEALVRRFWRRVFDERDLTAAREMLTADFRWRGSLGSESEGVEDFLAYATAAQVAMPDLTVSLDEVVVVGPQVWARLRFSATHRGSCSGNPVPAGGSATSGRRFTTSGTGGSAASGWSPTP